MADSEIEPVHSWIERERAGGSFQDVERLLGGKAVRDRAEQAGDKAGRAVMCQRLGKTQPKRYLEPLENRLDQRRIVLGRS